MTVRVVIDKEISDSKHNWIINIIIYSSHSISLPSHSDCFMEETSIFSFFGNPIISTKLKTFFLM